MEGSLDTLMAEIRGRLALIEQSLPFTRVASKQTSPVPIYAGRICRSESFRGKPERM